MKKNARLVEHFITFCNKFNKFNSAGACMFDSIYHMTQELFCYCVFGMKTSRFCHACLFDLIFISGWVFLG